MTVKERLFTVEDCWAMSHNPANDVRHFELSEGMLVEKALAGFKHGREALKLGRLIGTFVEAHGLDETRQQGQGTSIVNGGGSYANGFKNG